MGREGRHLSAGREASPKRAGQGRRGCWAALLAGEEVTGWAWWMPGQWGSGAAGQWPCLGVEGEALGAAATPAWTGLLCLKCVPGGSASSFPC